MSNAILDATFNAVLHLALHEGEKAYTECVPVPVQFRTANTVFRPEPEGNCGFAWVTIKPANSKFANWLKKQVSDQYRIHRGCYGGLELWPAGCSQSHERKRAWAEAVATRLRAADIRAHAGDRLD